MKNKNALICFGMAAFFIVGMIGCIPDAIDAALFGGVLAVIAALIGLWQVRRGKNTNTEQTAGIHQPQRVPAQQRMVVRTVYATKSGTRYHCTPYCETLHNARVESLTYAAAIGKRLVPCAKCYPYGD